MKVSTSGGQPVTLTESPAGAIRGASWGPDDQIIFGGNEGLFRVSGGGGEPATLTTVAPEQGEVGHFLPSIIPGANAVLFAIASAYPVATYGQLAVLDLDTEEVTRLGLVGTSPRYVSTGHLVYSDAGGAVRAVPFDAASLEVTGDPVQVVEGVAVGVGAAHFSFSDTGTLVYVSGSAADGENGLRAVFVWVDQDGREEPLSLPDRAYYDPRVSPDGRRVAVCVGDFGGGDLWVYDAISAAELRLTQGYAVRNPMWTPDGSRILFGSNQGDGWNLYSVMANGGGEAELLVVSEQWDAPTSVTPDGRTVAFTRSDGMRGRREIWEVGVDGDDPPVPLLQGEFIENAEYSPDGNWLAYESDESGATEVYVQPYPGPGGVLSASIGGGRDPVWAADGSHLFYRLDNQMMAVPFDTGDPAPIGAPRALFESAYVPSIIGGRQHHLAPDGRFLMMKRLPDASEEQTPTQINVVINWFQELTERVPID